jgi:hypothetical protein
MAMKPSPWPPTGGAKYIVEKVTSRGNGESFGEIAKKKQIKNAKGEIDPWVLIEFNFKTRDPRKVNEYLRDMFNAPVVDDRGNRTFKGGEEIYLPPTAAPPPPPTQGPVPTPAPGIPPPSTHPFRQGWDAESVGAYHRHVERKAIVHANSFAAVIDCANFAIQLLLDYALPNYLPVAFESASGVLRAEMESIVLITRFANEAKDRVGARDLNNRSYPQTVFLSGLAEAKTGDLLSGHDHVAVLYKYPSWINVPQVGGQRQVLEVLQGNLDWRLPGYGDLPTRVQHRAWDIKVAAGYVNLGQGWEVRENESRTAEDLVKAHVPKRWNFSWFNQLYGFPPV